MGQVDAPVYAMPCSIADKVPRRGGRLKVCRLHRPRYLDFDTPCMQRRRATCAGCRNVQSSRRHVDIQERKQIPRYLGRAIRPVLTISGRWPVYIYLISTWPRNHGHIPAHDIMDRGLAKRRRAPPDTCVAGRRCRQEPAAEHVPHRRFLSPPTARFNEYSATKRRCF